MFIWFFVSPIPAAITTQAPHAMRSYTMLPMWQIFSAFGIGTILSWFRLKYLRASATILLGLVMTIGVLIFTKQYFIVFPSLQSDSFQYPLAQAIPYVATHEGSYSEIIFSNKDALYQSYMFFLFFTKYDPVHYHEFGGTVSGGYEETHTIGKFQFRPIVWEKDKLIPNALIIGNSAEFPEDISTVGEFSTLDGVVKIKIIQT